MTPAERRASGSLATIFAARMLGLFLVLPVFALEAARYPGGDDPARIGLAMGIYGLTQGLLQIPFGMASDRLGRKRVIIFGLLVFAAGSFLAAAADSLFALILGRALQGAGAVSAAVTALLADQTRDAVRTKAMALVGASIGLMFALSLVAAPLLARRSAWPACSRSPGRWRWAVSPWWPGGRRRSRCSTGTCRAAGWPRC
jgi:MFS family permease